MNNIICHECGTENEPEYCYCKNCGAYLKSDIEKNNNQYNNSKNYNSRFNQSGSNYSQNTYNQAVILDTIEGVPSEDMAAFVGKNFHKIMAKFTKMELTGSKASWCWPAAVLSFLLGPLGAAIWFFYRKMYKAAVIFMAIGVVTSATVGIIGGSIVDSAVLESAGESFYSGDYGAFYNDIEQALNSSDTLRSLAANAVDSAVNIATMIAAGVFGFYFYKRHCVNSINRYRNRQVDPRYYKIGLASIGGTSSGMAVLGVAILILVSNLLSWLMVLV